jgi:hypothetical protein
MTPRRFDAEATARARRILADPSAHVFKEPTGSFTLERAGHEPLTIGIHFRDANRALHLLATPATDSR